MIRSDAVWAPNTLNMSIGDDQNNRRPFHLAIVLFLLSLIDFHGIEVAFSFRMPSCPPVPPAPAASGSVASPGPTPNRPHESPPLSGPGIARPVSPEQLGPSGR